MNVDASKWACWSMVLYSESWQPQRGRPRKGIFQTQKSNCLWVRWLESTLLILPFKLSSSSAYTSITRASVTAVFIRLQHQTECLLHTLPKWSWESVVSSLRDIIWKLRFWQVNTIYWSFVMVDMASITIRTQIEDMECKSCHWLHFQTLLNYKIHMCRW